MTVSLAHREFGGRGNLSKAVLFAEVPTNVGAGVGEAVGGPVCPACVLYLCVCVVERGKVGVCLCMVRGGS